MEAAFATFGAAVGAGMAGFVTTPPAGPIGFVPQFAGAKPPTANAAASAIAALIDTWMHTGIATMVPPPFTPVPWS
jgi:hypothetical protein